jgi:hypothetical protein
MLKNISGTLSAIELGEPQSHANMVVVPFHFAGNGPDYLTMKEVMERGLLVITEVSEGGNVPNLKVANKADLPVLLLDGEEVAGAKQNRVLNTTILVQAGSEVVIPVSCTEQGRWSYASREFAESGHVMSPNIRMMKNVSVSASYRAEGVARSDQGAVWEGIHRLSHDADASSQTGAMRDVFEKRAGELEDYIKAFTLKPAQKGLLVFIAGKDGAFQVVGFDFLSLDRAFGVLHPKLVKSYAMEAWVAARKEKKNKAGKPIDVMALAKEFLAEAAACEEKVYASVGLGQDFRYSGPRTVGSALVYEEAVLHMAFFRATEDEKIGHMAGMNRRRSFRV